MEKSLLIILLFLGLQNIIYGQDLKPQEHFVTVQGQVVNKETSETIPYVHIIDLSTFQGTTTDLQGQFQLKVSNTDTLVFSSVGFEKDTIFLSQENDKTLHLFEVSLQPSTLELEQVEVFAYKNEEAFKQAILNLKLPEEKQPNIFIPRASPNPSNNLSGNFALGSPLTAVQNLFSKEAKELKKYQEVMRDYPREKLINDKYNRKVVEKITGLTNESLNDFMLFCKIPDDFIEKANEYEIILAVNNCYKDFLQTQH